MPYEDDYKMWLEKMLIESNPDWVCDGMYDKEITRNWCVDYCGEDDEYITPKCLHMYYHHIERADHKTENSSEKPNNCEDLQDWKDRMWAEAIVTEPTISKMEQVDEPQTYVINPQEPTNDDKCFECDDFFTCGGQCNKIEDEPKTDCAWK